MSDRFGGESKEFWFLADDNSAGLRECLHDPFLILGRVDGTGHDDCSVRLKLLRVQAVLDITPIAGKDDVKRDSFLRQSLGPGQDTRETRRGSYALVH